MLKKKLLILLILSVLATFGFSNAENVDKLAEQIAKLRTDIEILHNQIDEIKFQIKNEIRLNQSQKADIQVRIERENLRLKELQRQLKKKKLTLKEKAKKHKNILPTVKEGIGILKEYINQSLPFKKKERLYHLENLERKIQNNLILPEKALNQLWAYYEDEIRLTKENGIYKDTINIDGKPYLVEIAKQGMIGLFFKTPDNRYGVIRKVGSDYKISLITNKNYQESIDNLFDSYKKQIRTGYFKIPNFLPTEVK